MESVYCAVRAECVNVVFVILSLKRFILFVIDCYFNSHISKFMNHKSGETFYCLDPRISIFRPWNSNNPFYLPKTAHLSNLVLHTICVWNSNADENFLQLFSYYMAKVQSTVFIWHPLEQFAYISKFPEYLLCVTCSC